MKTQRERIEHLAADDEDDSSLYASLVKNPETAAFVRSTIDRLAKDGVPVKGSLPAAFLMLGKLQAAIIGPLVSWADEGEKTEGMFSMAESFAELMNLSLISMRLAVSDDVPPSLLAFKRIVEESFGSGNEDEPERTLKWMATMSASVVSGTLKSSPLPEDDKVYVLLKTLAHLFYVGLSTAIDTDKNVDIGKLFDLFKDLALKRIAYAQASEEAKPQPADEIAEAFMKK